MITRQKTGVVVDSGEGNEHDYYDDPAILDYDLESDYIGEEEEDPTQAESPESEMILRQELQQRTWERYIRMSISRLVERDSHLEGCMY